MGAERGLRQRIRAAIRYENPDAMVVGQPANGLTGPGRHDLYVVVEGRYVGLEVKTSTGRATQIQLGRIRDTRRAGGYAWLVRSKRAACWAVRLARTGAPMAENADFDIDKLLASFRPEDLKQEPDDLDREIEGFKPSQALSEEHIASTAQANGTAAGDGEALGEIPTPLQALAAAVDGLTAAVRDLRATAERLRSAKNLSIASPGESTGSAEEQEELQALFGDLPVLPVPTEPASPPTRRRRKPAL